MTDDRAIAEAATPGPWEAHEDFADPGELHNVWRARDGGHVAVAHDISEFPDATFIAHFNPAKILAMLDRQRDLEAEIGDWLIIDGATPVNVSRWKAVLAAWRKAKWE